MFNLSIYLMAIQPSFALLFGIIILLIIVCSAFYFKVVSLNKTNAELTTILLDRDKTIDDYSIQNDRKQSQIDSLSGEINDVRRENNLLILSKEHLLDQSKLSQIKYENLYNQYTILNSQYIQLNDILLANKLNKGLNGQFTTIEREPLIDQKRMAYRLARNATKNESTVFFAMIYIDSDKKDPLKSTKFSKILVRDEIETDIISNYLLKWIQAYPVLCGIMEKTISRYVESISIVETDNNGEILL